MPYVGGDITEITWNHATLGSGVLRIKGSEDNTYDLGGVRGNDDDNQVTGVGDKIRQLNTKGWNVNVTVAWDMNVNLDLEKINALAADPVEAEWTITSINGSIYGGFGAPVGDLVGNVNNATFPLKIAGGRKLEKKA
jgi:hypothetical protein